MVIVRPDWLRFFITYYMQRFFMLPLVWLIFRVVNRVEVEGLENLELVAGESIILAPNHTTAWDGWVGTVWAFSSRHRFVSRDSYMGVMAAPENIPTPFLRLLVSSLGAIPVDRDQGVDQFALQDTVRLINEKKKTIVLTVYPEGTRSKTGRLRRRGRPGIGWIQHQTNVPVVPIYHVGGPQMPGIGRRMRIRIGKPIRFDHTQDEPNELMTWRNITEEVMDSLRAMEAEEQERPLGSRGRRRRYRQATRRLNSVVCEGLRPPHSPPASHDEGH